jgi:hypothetical protein
MLRCFRSKLLSWRARGRRKPPTVSSKGHIGEDEKNYAAENHSFPHCEIAPHQILE